MPTADGGSQTKELEETKKTVVWSYCSGSSKVGMYSVVMPVSSVQGKKRQKKGKGKKVDGLPLVSYATPQNWVNDSPLFFLFSFFLLVKSPQDVTCVGVRGVRGVIIRGTFFFCDPYSVFRTEYVVEYGVPLLLSRREEELGV